MKSNNPLLREDTFSARGRVVDARTSDQAMTINGTIVRTFILLMIVSASATWAWWKTLSFIAQSQIDGVDPMAGGGPFTIATVCAIAGFVLALVVTFARSWSPVLAPVYAFLEGFALGVISAIIELSHPGIVMQAVLATFGTLGVMLVAYRAGWIRATERFKSVMFAAMGGLMVLYLATFILGFFGVHMAYLHDSGPLSIGFSAVVATIAAFNLILDFDLIEQGEASSAPKYMEWYSAFALLVTLVWLYLEILRLLSKVYNRR